MNASAELDPRGVYGFRITGVPGARELLVDAPAHWPSLQIEARVHPGPDPDEEFSEESALLPLRSGGWVTVDRAAGLARFWLRAQPTAAALVHPHLGAAALASAYWLGRESFHAGAFVSGGGVWVVLGEREAGKSTLLASLALAGIPVVSDDILVLDGATAMAGPRSVDLRTAAALALGVGEPLGVLGTRERWRLALPSIEPELPLRGWISLQWADETAVRPVRGAERLRRIAAGRGVLLYPRDAGELIELSTFPVLELARPRRWEAQGDAIARLLDATV